MDREQLDGYINDLRKEGMTMMQIESIMAETPHEHVESFMGGFCYACGEDMIPEREDIEGFVPCPVCQGTGYIKSRKGKNQ